MNFIEIEESVKEKEWDMTDLHGHSHYELYFLRKGSRQFFLKNAMYKINAPCFIAIPPYTMHKTEGFAFSRVNVNLSADSLNPYESSVLKRLAEKIIPLNKDNADKIFGLLEKAIAIYKTGDKYSAYKINALLSNLIIMMDESVAEKKLMPVKANTDKVSPLALKIIDYISTHYAENVSLGTLSKTFYISKVSLCFYFKSAMNCTIGEYVMKLRLTKAKEYLTSTKKRVEEIAYLCGFSSGAYMGLIFKEKIGLSPLQYRKLQNTKK